MHASHIPSPALSHRDIKTIVGGIILAMLLGALDQTIVATAMPTIGRELGDEDQVSWVASIYLLTATAVTPLYGKLSDIHGRRIVLLTAIIIFTLSSIACALAPTMFILIVARAVQGLGGGGLISLAQTIIADIIAPKERGRYQIYMSSVYMIASVLGPVLGGFFTEHLHWSLIFWINLPLGLAAYLMTSSTLKKLPRHDRPHQLDVLGAVLMVIATVSLMLALTFGGIRFGWSSMPILGLLGISVLFWALFGLRLAKAHEPLIPVELLSNQVVRMGTLSAFFGMGTYIGLTIYMPVYFETVSGLSASNSGLALIPLMIGTVCGATLSGRVMLQMENYKRLPMWGLSGAMAGMAMLIFAGKYLPLAAVELIIGLVSIGLGTLLPVTTVAIQNAVEPHQLGTATGTANFFRQLGSALLVAMFGALLLTGSGAETAEMLHATLTGEVAVATFRLIFIAVFAGFFCAFIFIWRMEQRPLKARAKHAAEAIIAD